ncbi:MAG: hypothetical protein FJ303_08170 [Planctomycetes bacterium]|nr:hypothetical protein [Planctomycetota bacterium]
MNNKEHDELIDSLAELRQALPSMRLGQLIANMATIARGAVAGAIWEMEDEELLAAIRWQLDQLSVGAAAAASEPPSGPAGMSDVPSKATARE